MPIILANEPESIPIFNAYDQISLSKERLDKLLLSVSNSNAKQRYVLVNYMR